MTEKSDAEIKRVDELLEKIKAWAAEKELTDDVVAAAFGGKQPLPPNHTCVTWFDVHRPDGGKIHVVVRGGATRRSVLDTVFTASNVFGDLVEQGWMPADRKPRTEAEIAETAAKVEEKLGKKPKTGAKRKAKKADSDNGGEADPTRTIKVKSITKKMTENGNPFFLVKGPPWTKYGVTAWPDSGQVGKLAGLVDMDAWEVGELADFSGDDIQAVVQLKDGGKPGKVINFVGDDVVDAPDEA